MHAADKARLRRRFADARARRPADAIDAARAAVREHVLARCLDEHWSTVAAYVPLRTEPGSAQLLATLTRSGVRALVPVVLPSLDLDWVEWDEDHPSDPMATVSADRVRMGVDAIATADAVLVPALAVSRDGVRLGRGGGSYDRALARVAGGVLVAAVLFDDEIVPDLPADPWDRPVGAAVTPSGWIELHGNAVVGQDG